MGYDGTLKFDTQVNTKGFESGANQITNLANGAVKGLSSILTKATSALTGLGKSVVQVGTQFETSMSNVAAISGATGDELDALTKKAQEMGAKTKFSASESADAFSYMAMAGWKTEEMLGGIEGIMNLAAASGEDLATTSDIVTDALTAFGLKAKDSGHFADILAAASSNANTNVGLMGETFKYVAPVAGALGFSAEDTAQAIGLMANAGIKGSQAGTALRSVFSRLAKPTKQSQQALDDLGLSLTDDAGNVKDLNTLLLEMRQKFSTLSDAQKANYAALLAGQEGMSGLLAIVNASDADWNKLAGAIDGCTDELTGYSAAEEMAAKQIDNLEGQVTILKSSLEGLKIKLYQGVETPLKEIVKGVQGMVQQLTDAFDKGGFDGLVSAVGDVLSQAIDKIAKAAPKFINMAVSLVHSFCEGLTKADGIAETSASLVSAVIKGIMSVVGDIVTTANYLIVELVKGMETHLPDLLQTGIDIVLNIINGAVQTIPQLLPLAARIIGTLAKTLVSNIPRITDAVINIVSAIIDGITAAAPELLNAAIELFSSIAEALPVIKTKLISALNNIIGSLAKNISTAVPKLTKSIKSLISSIAAALPDILKSFTGIVLDIIQQILDIIIDIAPELLNCITEVITSLVSALPDLLEMLVEAIPDVLSSIGEAIIALTPKILESVTQVIKAIAKALPNIIISIIDVLPSVVDNIIKTLLEMLPELIKAGTTLLSSLVNGLPTAIDNIVDKVVDIVDSIVDKLLELLPQLVECGIDIILNLISGFNKALPNLLQSVTGIVVKLAESLAQNASKIAAVASDIANALIDGLTAALPQLLEAVTNILSAILKVIPSIAGAILKQLPSIIKTIVNGITKLIPKLVECIKSVIQELAKALPQIISAIVEVLPELIKQIVNALVELAPVIIDGVLQIITALVEALPELITAIVEVLPELIDSIVQAILECLPQLLDCVVQIVMAIVQALPDIILAIINVLPEIIDSIVNCLLSLLPQIVETGITLLTSLVAELPTIIKTITDALPEIINQIVKTLLSMIPQIVECGLDLLVSLVEALPEIIDNIVACIPDIIDAIITCITDNFPLIVETGLLLFTSLIEKLPEISIRVSEAIPEIITSIINAIIESLPKLWSVGFTLFTSIIKDLPSIISKIVSKIPNIISGIVTAFGKGITEMYEIGKRLIEGLWEGIKSMGSWLGDRCKDFGNAWVSGFKTIFGIHSPSKLFRDEIGKNLVLGLADGITDNATVATEALKDVAKDISTVEFSVSEPETDITGKLADSITESGLQATNDLQDIFSGLDTVELDFAIPDIDANLDGFSEIVQDEMDKTKNTVQKTVDDLSSSLDQFKQDTSIIDYLNKLLFGDIENVKNEFQNDISREVSWLCDYASDFSDIVIDNVNEFITSQLPLNLFNDEINENFVLELTDGITDNATTATEALQALQDTYDGLSICDIEITVSDNGADITKNLLESLSEFGIQAAETIQDIFNGLDAIEIDVEKPEISCGFDSLAEGIKDYTETAKSIVQQAIDDINSFFSGFIPKKRAEDYLDRILSNNDLKQSVETPDFLKNAREVVSRITGQIQATVNTEASKIAYDKTAPQEYEQSRNDRRSQTDINVTGQLESDRPIEVHTVLYLDKRKLAEEITPAVNHEMYKIDQRENNRGRGN